MRKGFPPGKILLGLLTTPRITFAAAMPWNSPLEQIGTSITGPFAKTIGTIAIICTGLSLAAAVPRGMIKRVVQVVFGLSVAFTAASFFLGFLGYSE